MDIAARYNNDYYNILFPTVINSTANVDGHSKSDEDRKARVRAIAINSRRGGEYGSFSTSVVGLVVDRGEDDNFFYDETKRNDQQEKVNSNDYYISSEDVYFSNGDDQELTNTSQDVPELKAKLTEQTTPRRVVVTATTVDPLESLSSKKSIRVHLKSEVGPTQTIDIQKNVVNSIAMPLIMMCSKARRFINIKTITYQVEKSWIQ
ncbi:unnamed protein product [Ceratitis capitata]|uniref:(Mediterranean fruit fly) hypothetical protein n=1 Tax=Ceratitis capitata TaxID=7213 RepID=A0A811VHA7_CERCA|nr:unnamed protein product [Ceratitis capitata]